MRRILACLFVLSLVSSVVLSSAGPADAAALAARVPRPPRPPIQRPSRDVCSRSVPSFAAHCDAQVVTNATGQTPQLGQPAGAQPNVLGNNGAYDPSYLRAAYNLPSTSAGNGETVAIVDAYDDPNAARDLNYYRAAFGLPACTSANGCFRKVNQNGRAYGYPAADSGWAEEISLDLDMVSAICPNCKILLVEARSNYYSDLGTAENTAARLGASAISNSYGGGEFGSENSYASSYYNHPGIAITASSGDGSYGVEFPAAASTVTAVGGTSLVQDPTSGAWSETAWGGAGSGCSAYVAKPSWQTDAGCGNRSVADVAAVADPSTGVWAYDTYQAGGWMIFGGTSVASPIIASVYALAGNAQSVTYGSYPYAHTSSLNDVISGSNGSCGGSYLCTAGPGYDGPTGLGTPNGTGGF